MKHLILGTAGHIDHGKTSLVKALTGINTDRLKEEKARGITIELGFAHLQLSDGVEFGVVDVPGHEKFVRAMVAGAAGMDLVMLVIAADEGVMPQTREHLDILRLLGLHNGLVVLTKSDMVAPDWLNLVQEEVREFVAGSFLEDAAIMPVSSKTGAGLEELKSELSQLAKGVTQKKCDGPFRLPVDRVFTVAGFGTVVTGTLLAGEIRVGDELELLPARHRGRVRGIQAHGTRSDTGQAGQRLAVNLHGIDLDQAHRGDLVVPPDTFRTSRRVDVRLEHLASAPRNLRHRTTVRFHSGTSETAAQVILLEKDLVEPGKICYAQLRLESPQLLVSGDPYLIRSTSPAVTIGGGIVLDPFPPARRRRSEEALKLLYALDETEHQKTCELIVNQSLLSGVTIDEVLLRSGIPRRQAEAALQTLLTAGSIVQMLREPRTFLARTAVEQLKQILLDELIAFMAANQIRDGISREELKTRMPKRSDQRFFAPLLAELEKEGKLQSDRDLVRLVGAARPETEQSSTTGIEIRNLLDKSGMEPPTIKEMSEKLGCTEKVIREHLSLFLRDGSVSRVSSEIFYSSGNLKRIEDQLIAHLKEKGEIIPSEFRDLTGLSRKFMIPLLEYFDSLKLTIRVGDKRILRGR